MGCIDKLIAIGQIVKLLKAHIFMKKFGRQSDTNFSEVFSKFLI